jgi:hypothetical protein
MTQTPRQNRELAPQTRQINAEAALSDPEGPARGHIQAPKEPTLTSPQRAFLGRLARAEAQGEGTKSARNLRSIAEIEQAITMRTADARTPADAATRRLHRGW